MKGWILSLLKFWIEGKVLKTLGSFERDGRSEAIYFLTKTQKVIPYEGITFNLSGECFYDCLRRANPIPISSIPNSAMTDGSGTAISRDTCNTYVSV